MLHTTTHHLAFLLFSLRGFVLFIRVKIGGAPFSPWSCARPSHGAIAAPAVAAAAAADAFEVVAHEAREASTTADAAIAEPRKRRLLWVPEKNVSEKGGGGGGGG